MNKQLFFYGIFLLTFTFFTYLFVDPNLNYFEKVFTGFAFNNRQIVTTSYILLVMTFFIFYYYIYQKVNNKNIKKYIFISIIFLFFSYPAFLSSDIFNYIFTSKVLFFYQENPYIIMPIEFIKDPMLLFTHSPNKVALYGPLWVLLTGIPHYFGVSNFVFTLFSFKFLAIIFYLGISYVIFKISNDIKSVAFFALNPLVLIETAISSHNDVAMMFFAISSLYFLKKNKILLAIVLIVASIFIKYATILLLPVFIYYFYLKYRRKKINWGKMFMISAVLMFSIFFMSAFREEIYPWYSIWFLTFLALIPKYKLLRSIGLLLSFVMLLRYIPFMYLGTHFGPTPMIKILIIFIPLSILIFVYLIIKRKLLFKKLRENEINIRK